MSKGTQMNSLTAREKAEGWRLLFDGKTFAGWRGLGWDRVPEGHWEIEDGAIKKIASGDVPLMPDGQPARGGDLMTVGTFQDFELAFEWKISFAGNSGVKYNVSEEFSLANAPNHAALGFEYQVLDDEHFPDPNLRDNQKAAGLYDLIAPVGADVRPAGEFNQAKIIFRGNHGEHWLNGVKVLEYDLGTPVMEARLAASKFRALEGFADRRRGHIIIQDHTDAAWFRNIKIREF